MNSVFFCIACFFMIATAVIELVLQHCLCPSMRYVIGDKGGALPK